MRSLITFLVVAISGILFWWALETGVLFSLAGIVVAAIVLWFGWAILTLIGAGA
jgi:hypothetical protein